MVTSRGKPFDDAALAEGFADGIIHLVPV